MPLAPDDINALVAGVLTHPTIIRSYRSDGQTFDEESAPFAQVPVFGHIEAQLAKLAADRAAASSGTAVTAINDLAKAVAALTATANTLAITSARTYGLVEALDLRAGRLALVPRVERPTALDASVLAPALESAIRSILGDLGGQR